MPRTPRKRQWTDEACYHVMNRGHNRERIFGDDDDRRQFLRGNSGILRGRGVLRGRESFSRDENDSLPPFWPCAHFTPASRSEAATNQLAPRASGLPRAPAGSVAGRQWWRDRTASNRGSPFRPHSRKSDRATSDVAGSTIGHVYRWRDPVPRTRVPLNSLHAWQARGSPRRSVLPWLRG